MNPSRRGSAFIATAAAALARCSAAIGRPADFVITSPERPDVDPGELVPGEQVDDPSNFRVFEIGFLPYEDAPRWTDRQKAAGFRPVRDAGPTVGPE